ncbi:SMP-30/gluconolactonase/LRE family protein [Millisia brevis]|uniref:SMP-30/gluconolactonase/LRE family protein n=1 Tax=Millisia brevis TaxID=264148 RepID=UPI00082F633A|nr:SMP-30/gluconolactonase/LRE family protein [Millisia brevis]
MSERDVRVFFQGGAFFEGPRWHDGRWWASDFYRRQVATYDDNGVETVLFTVDQQPSGLGWLADGTLVVVSMRDRKILRWADGELTELADVSAHCGGHLNDLVVDANDHIFVGNFGFDLMGGGAPELASLIRVDPDGSVAVVAKDLFFPNGMVISPDGATLTVGETLGNRYTAFDLAADGTLSGRRVVAEFAPQPEGATFEEVLGQIAVAPDGCTLDAEGHIWAADALGNRAVRVAPGGEIVDEVRVPTGAGIYACQLGGPDGRTLLLCSAPDFFEHNRKDTREAVLYTTIVDVPHAGRP